MQSIIKISESQFRTLLRRKPFSHFNQKAFSQSIAERFVSNQKKLFNQIRAGIGASGVGVNLEEMTEKLFLGWQSIINSARRQKRTFQLKRTVSIKILSFVMDEKRDGEVSHPKGFSHESPIDCAFRQIKTFQSTFPEKLFLNQKVFFSNKQNPSQEKTFPRKDFISIHTV